MVKQDMKQLIMNITMLKEIKMQNKDNMIFQLFRSASKKFLQVYFDFLISFIIQILRP